MAAGVSLFRRRLDEADGSLVKFDRHTTDVGRNIDRLSGRLGLLVDVAATLGPALIPTAAAAVPLLAGLSNQLGFAAIAGASTIVAFQGVGDALGALNDYQLDPSAANFEKLNEAMATLGPAGRDFVRELQAMRPEMQKLQDAAQAGLFPGMTEGIESLMTRMPEAERIISEVTDTIGDLTARSGEALAGDDWDQFFAMLETEARPTLTGLGESLGNVTRGLAELWIAFAPLNRDFSDGMVEASESFAQWADGLSQTQGFAEFVEYLRTTGPQVADTLSALGGALLDVLEAAAPLGGPALAAIEAFSKAISAIADSDIGTPLLAGLAAMRAYGMAASLAGRATQTAWGGRAKRSLSEFGAALTTVTTAQQRAQMPALALARAERERSAALRSGLATMGKGAGIMGGLAVASTGAADGIGLTNTASLALMGTMAGPWGAAIGGTVGLTMDLANAHDGLADAVTSARAAMNSGDVDAMRVAYTRLNAEMERSKSLGDKPQDYLSPVSGVGLIASITRRRAQSQAAEAQQDLRGAMNGAAAFNISRGLARATQMAAQGYRLTAAGAREAAMSTDQFVTSTRRASAELGRMGALDSYRSSLLDLKDSLRDNGRTLAINTRAGLANRAALRRIAESALDAAGQMQNFGRRTAFLERARGAFIRSATAAGMTRREAKRLADQLGLVDRMDPKVKITAQTEAARADVAAFRSLILDATRPRTATITVRKVGGIGALVDPSPGGRSYAGGGWTGPGSKFQPAGVVHADEFVFSTEATQGNIPLLDALHDQLRGYSGGGHVSPSSISVGSPKVSLAGARITAVFPGVGEVVGRIVDDRIADHDDMADMTERTVA